MAVTGNAALVATKQDLIAALVQKELISKGVLINTIQDVSRFAVKGAKTISFPKAGSFTVEDRASGAQATIQNLTFAVDQLPLDKMATVSWLIDPQDELESVLDVDAEYAVRAAAAHAAYVDGIIAAELETVGVATTTAAATITDAVILEMRSALLRREANPNSLYLAISPEQEAGMLAINKFTLAEQYGSQIIPAGVLGRIYGVNVVVSTQVEADEYYMYDRDGLCIGFQRGPTLGERGAPEYGATAMLKTLDQKFGVKGLQIAQAGVGAGLSALVVKDNNA